MNQEIETLMNKLSWVEELYVIETNITTSSQSISISGVEDISKQKKRIFNIRIKHNNKMYQFACDSNNSLEHIKNIENDLKNLDKIPYYTKQITDSKKYTSSFLGAKSSFDTTYNFTRDELLKNVNIQVSNIQEEVSVSNNFGFHYNAQFQYGTFLCEIVLGKKEKHSIFEHRVVDKKFKPLDLVNKLMNNCKIKLNQTKLSSGKYNVQFSQNVMDRMIYYIIESMRADSIIKGTSFLKNEKNLQIFASNVNFVEDSTKGLYNYVVDFEGIPTKRKYLIQNGRVVSFIADRTNGKKLGIEPGNSYYFRENITNLHMESDRFTPIKDGLYIDELIGASFKMDKGELITSCSGFVVDKGIKIKAFTNGMFSFSAQHMRDLSFVNEEIISAHRFIPSSIFHELKIDF